MPSSDSEDSSEDVQDVEMSDLDSDDLSNVILPTGSVAKKSAKISTHVKPVAGTSKKYPRTPVARKRNTKVLINSQIRFFFQFSYEHLSLF